MTNTILQKTTSLLCKVIGQSPVIVWFSANEKVDCRVEDIAVLEVYVMPWHLAPGKASNSSADLYNQEQIIVNLEGGVSRHEDHSDRLNQPFTIK